jgi:hypothetical protein
MIGRSGRASCVRHCVRDDVVQTGTEKKLKLHMRHTTSESELRDVAGRFQRNPPNTTWSLMSEQGAMLQCHLEQPNYIKWMRQVRHDMW